MDAIINTVPWCCGFDDGCAQGWHKANYWSLSGGGYSVDNYADGDHESIDEADLPSLEESTKAWLEYARYVAETGLDPIEEYPVKHVITKRERWEFRVSISIAGLILTEIRRAGVKYHPSELPEHVVSFFNLNPPQRRLQDFDQPGARQEFESLDYKLWRWNVAHIDARTPRAPTALARDLRRAARAHIRRLETTPCPSTSA